MVSYKRNLIVMVITILMRVYISEDVVRNYVENDDHATFIINLFCIKRGYHDSFINTKIKFIKSSKVFNEENEMHYA